jgi:hypothetical protein
MGTPRVNFGTGYRITYLTYSQHVLHGYFNPREYVSHMAIAGLRFRLGKTFRAEYMARVGEESYTPGALTVRDPYHLAWELGLRNRAVFRHWELGADYYYWRLAQTTGAYRAQGGSIAVGYRF